MAKDKKVLLEQILDSIAKIESYVEGLTFEEFSRDAKTVDAVTWQIAVLGEAASGLPEDFRAYHSDIPWRKIIDTRNRIIHGYASLDMYILWAIAENDLEDLENEIELILGGLT